MDSLHGDWQIKLQLPLASRDEGMTVEQRLQFRGQ